MLFFLLTFIYFTTASAVTCSSIKDDVNFCNNGFRYKAGNANVECSTKANEDKCDVDSTSGDNNNQHKCCDPPLSTGCVVPSNALPPTNGNLGTCIPGSKMGKQYEVISVNAGVVAINSNSPMSNVKVGERMTFASVDQGSPCPALGEVFVTVLDSATSFTVEKRGDGNNVPNDYVGSTAVAGCQIKRTDEESEHCWYSCNNEWTITFSANVVAAAGAAVTQNSVTAKLKDAITSGMTSAVIQVAKYVKITVGDVVIDGTTISISKSIISARYTTKDGGRNSNYPGNPNFGFTDGNQKVCKNEKGFACQSGEVCKLGHYSQGYDSSGTSCSFCSKCTTKANGEGSACTWQQARMYSIYVEGRKYTDGCHCGAVPATQCLTATGDAAGDCYCPASVDEYTDSIYVPSVQCKSWSHTNNGVRSMYSDLVGGSDNWWGKNIGKTYGNVDENSKIGWIDNSANKDAVIQISVYEGNFHVQNIVAGGTGYVDGNTIIISDEQQSITFSITFTVTSENGDGILTANELVATGSVNSDMFNGPTSWTTGAMPEVFQCRLALCPYEEMAAQITGTVDATESGSCNGWPGRGVEKCSQKATPPIICSESTCANGVTVPGKCYVPQYCGTFGGTCPTGSQKKHSNYEKEHECRGETCDVFDCCSSTCKLGFFDKQETCGASLQPIDHLESECNVQADGKCLLKSCCKRTCASDFDATGKCSGGRSKTIKTGEAAKEQTCDGEQCDENECCPLYCKNLETSPCTLASQQLSKNTCSSESQCNENHCCYVGCAAWAANTGGTPRTCNPAKILKSNDWDQDRCDSNICDETKCCVDPPDCGHETRTSAIGSSGCMCGSASSKTLCSQGKHCWDPNSDIGSNNQCLVKAKPKSCNDIPCNENEGLEKKYPTICEGSACTCKSTDTCDKNTCCKKKSCTGDDIISGTPCMCGGSDAECAVGKYCWEGQCKQSDHPRCGGDEKTAINTICMCGGGAEGGKQCGVGKYCWSGKCTTDAPPAKCGDTVKSCSDSTKNIKSWEYCGLNQKIKTCDEASCCQNPSCPGDGNTANDKKCDCESGSYSVECPIGHYCFHEHGKPTCMPKNKDSYPRQRCSAGFFGWQGNPDTCPTAFSKRETSDGHEGQAMDFRSCCRANCKDMYANCDAIDSSIPVSDDHCYPKSDGTCDQAEDCCYKTCRSWNGETCPAGTTRRSEHDRHRCHNNVCNAAECCQEPSMCEKWKNSGGTCTNEKPQHKNPDDRHHCSDDNCDADECCSELHCDGDGTTKTDQKCKCGGADCNVGQFCHDNHMCSDESKKDESNNGDDESQECTDSKAITHKDEQSDNDAGTYVSQCYDVSTNSEEDVTKWTFKKGTGSCTICKDALQLRFGPKCEGAPGKDCKHCQGIIDAYKDCPKTDKEKCEDSKAITHKDYQGDDDAGTHVSQCFDVSTNSEEDATKWTFKKGTGSCTICKDALQLQFGSTCEGAPGKECPHCQGIIDAYNDCPTTDSKPTVAPTEDEIVVITQTLSITGVTAAEVCTSTGKQAIEIIIADILDVDENNVQISKCIDTTSRRSRRLLASGIDLEYQVSLLATEATAKKQSEVVGKMATLEGESAATTLVVAAVAKAAGKDIGDVTVKGSAPVVTVETDDGDWGAGELGGATTTSMSTSIGVIIICSIIRIVTAFK